MKKTRFLVFTLAILLICCLTLVLIACGGNNDKQSHTHVWDKAYSKDDFDHWFACSGCEEKTNLQTHTFELKANDNETWKECSVCNHIKDKIEYAKGLEYMFNEYDNSYSVTGIGTETATKIAIPSTYEGKPVTIISAYAFENCFKLTHIVIPNSVTEINSSAFSGCTELASINIPDGVTYIESRAFQDCHKLTSIPIPDSVTSIGRQAFKNCYSLVNITIGKSVSYIGGNVFAGCKELSSIVVDENNDTYKSEGNCVLDSTGTSLILGCKNSIIPDSVTTIEEEAFYECSGLTNINIPDNVTEIIDYAFYNCYKLTSITFGKSVSNIHPRNFSGSNELSIIVVDENNSNYKSEGNCVLDSTGTTLILGCKNSIIPDSVTTIGEEAFIDCFELTNITISNNVTTIDDHAFYNCSKLTNITFEGTKADWNAISKSSNWDSDTGNYIIICTDGKLDKNGNEIA